MQSKINKNLFKAAFIIGLLCGRLSIANEHGGDEHGGGAHAASVPEDIKVDPLDPMDEIKVTETPDDIQLPKKLWEDLAIDSSAMLQFAQINVVLENKNEGILRTSPLRIAFPRGGGVVDLSRYLSGRQGSFYVRFEFERSAPKETLKSYFVSRVKKRKVEKEIIGAGCKKFFEIQAGLQKVSPKPGLLVNTTRNRHIAVLGGVFVFAAIRGKDVRLSQITFIDSTKPDYFCESKTP